MVFMVAAYMFIWLAVFIFVISMVRRQAGIQKELAVLEALSDEKQEKP
jgi:CcmD family protein